MGCSPSKDEPHQNGKEMLQGGVATLNEIRAMALLSDQVYEPQPAVESSVTMHDRTAEPTLAYRLQHYSTTVCLLRPDP